VVAGREVGLVQLGLDVPRFGMGGRGVAADGGDGGEERLKICRTWKG
jgi:hypothetical protein